MSKRKRVILGVGVVLLLGGVGFWRLKAQPAIPSFLRKFPNVRHVATTVVPVTGTTSRFTLQSDYLVEAQPEDVVESLGREIGFNKIWIHGAIAQTHNLSEMVVALQDKGRRSTLAVTSEEFTESKFDQAMGKLFSSWKRYRYGVMWAPWGSNLMGGTIEVDGLKKRHPEVKVN